jgi:hypothetical protein
MSIPRIRNHKKNNNKKEGPIVQGDPAQVLTKYENRAAKLAQEYEEDMVRL